jgi:hypothetical protein
MRSTEAALHARVCKTCHRARVRMERRLHGHRDRTSVEEKSL